MSDCKNKPPENHLRITASVESWLLENFCSCNSVNAPALRAAFGEEIFSCRHCEWKRPLNDWRIRREKFQTNARLLVLRLPLGGRERRTMAGVNIADGHHLATTKSVYVQNTHILDDRHTIH
jgi:hypothetical protein